MKYILMFSFISFLSACFSPKHKVMNTTNTPPVSIYDISLKTLDGKEDISMSQFKGKYLVIVNVASECGYTPQYKDLQQFYSQNTDKNIALLACPCNQFGAQEPGTAEQIANFCEKNYGVTFPISEKLDVKGAQQHPLYKWLTSKEQNGVGDFDVKWNFNKFIITPEGKLSHYFASSVKPTDSIFLQAVGLN